MQQAHPLELLQRATAAVDTPPDPEVWRWVKSGLVGLLRGHDPVAALGLTREECYQHRMATRNRWLREALDLIEGANKTARHRELAKRMRRFESHTWPRWRDLDEPPERASPLQVCLFWARYHHPLPGARQLHNLL